ncbi:hypothetical protein [Halovenus salina]|uniref:Uncharacterized protein n=1 Tax=Halovenus salina TaxID=1510225 RepID=A0ABD5W641_9EURY|nr:hypothetical protein [Halovenus salina]
MTEPNPNDETNTVEVVEESNPHLTEEVESLSTFSEQEGPLSLRIIPVIEGGQTDWRILVYMSGTQGPVYQSRDGMTDAAAQQFGISERLQQRLNDALAYAKQELEIPDGLGDQKREKRTLHELEVMMEE